MSKALQQTQNNVAQQEAQQLPDSVIAAIKERSIFNLLLGIPLALSFLLVDRCSLPCFFFKFLATKIKSVTDWLFQK